MMVLIDTEFTSLIGPELLSLGMATADNSGETFYAEVDLESDAGKRLVSLSSEMVREGVLPQWGRVAGAAATPWELGRRAGEWLLALHARTRLGSASGVAGTDGAADTGGRISIGFDYSDDYALLEDAMREAGLWDQVREVVRPAHINAITGTIEGEIAAEECYSTLRAKGLGRHHALADALALRAAYLAVRKGIIEAFGNRGKVTK